MLFKVMWLKDISVRTVVFSILCLSISNTANAHSMVAQHGTLNFIDNHVFLLLSLPVSAFKYIDDDNDGAVSLGEFNNYRKEISADVHKQVFLTTQEKPLLIEGLLLSPSIAHSSKSNYIDQVSVMGRYTLPNASSKVDFTIRLFGTKKEELKYTIKATNKKEKLFHNFEIKPALSVKVFN